MAGPRLAAVCAVLAALTAGCGGPPLYGPAEPGSPPSPGGRATVSLQLFRQAETGPLARAFQSDAAAFNRDSKNPHVPVSVLGEDAGQVSADIAAWSEAMRRAPVPPGYEQARAQLLASLALMSRGYQHIGDGLLYGEAGQLRQGRADVRAGSRMLARTRAAVSTLAGAAMRDSDHAR